MKYPEYDDFTLDQLYNERKSIGFQLESLGKQYHALRLRVENLKLRIRAMRNGEEGIGISDHAVIRYLERVKGLDMTEVRNEIRKHIATKIVTKTADQVITDDIMSVAIYDGERVSTIWRDEERPDGD
jgi:hypothetical protein